MPSNWNTFCPTRAEVRASKFALRGRQRAHKINGTPIPPQPCVTVAQERHRRSDGQLRTSVKLRSSTSTELDASQSLTVAHPAIHLTAY